jgi:hypothetical protein
MAGLPAWYMEELLKQQFERESADAPEEVAAVQPASGAGS